jgi:hypothetical protein
MTDEQLEAITEAARQWFADDAGSDAGKTLHLRTTHRTCCVCHQQE